MPILHLLVFGSHPVMLSWQDWGYYIGCQESIQSQLPARQAPYQLFILFQPRLIFLYCFFLPTTPLLFLIQCPRLPCSTLPHPPQGIAPSSSDTTPKTHPYLFGSQEAEDEKSVLMAAVQCGGEEANLLLPELGNAFYDMAR